MNIREVVVERLEPPPFGMDPLQALGKHVKEFRERNNLSIAVLARMARLREYQIDELERGALVSKDLTLFYLWRIANNLGATLKIECEESAKEVHTWSESVCIGLVLKYGRRISFVELKEDLHTY